MANSMGNHIRRLQKLGSRDMAKAAARGLYRAGQLIEAEAERSITEGAVSGEFHVPSLPGQPPNEDTGALRRSIETHIRAEGKSPVVEVAAGGPSAPYAPHLEYGTSKMAARPFMRPATDKHRADVAKEVAAQVSIEIRRR